MAAANGVDGVESGGAVAVELQDAKPKRGCSFHFDAFQFFGLSIWFLVLYSIYAGYFAVLLKIALEVRKSDYLTLNSKLTGSIVPDDAYVTPWMYLKNNGLTG